MQLTFSQKSFAFFASVSRCSLVTLGMGTKSVVPSCCGFKPELIIASFTCVMCWGVAVRFIIINCGFFCTTCPSWIRGNFPSGVSTGRLSNAPRDVLTDNCSMYSFLRCSSVISIWAFIWSKLITLFSSSTVRATVAFSDLDFLDDSFFALLRLFSVRSWAEKDAWFMEQRIRWFVHSDKTWAS